MGIHFRKRVKILPGVHLNISKTGTSWSLGPRGASVNVGKKGVYVNTGIPGTGIYSRTKVLSHSNNKQTIYYKEKESEVINKNPLKFIFTFLFLWASIMIPMFTSASWIWFPILAFIGICCAFIPNKEHHIYYKSDAEYNALLSNLPSLDPLFFEAAICSFELQEISTSIIQRRFAIGYYRAGRIIKQLKQARIISSSIENNNLYTMNYKDEAQLKELFYCLKEEMFYE